ncbi:phosphoribosylamine--glycine ligase [Rhodoblastus acidophilus]|uniref:Phosphoribosylamine--glycine ligase n=1 Tax=Rhodoblastus acidophilus TaxID=1074 RepID=A0A212QZQ5_RHOAC|nr:phosphoribosylamine--glycine ligase [Rhodoblastus acidophilus]MCW2315667.1 phosphoribosylamine--glycine ligase [Rhodoblastus acidophilus]PPQ40515.1 phosphoribosylamine--glycine ligase [Rhodoblastus acidophilus]RAI18649.1 phosphoribosylamine--glycine ligase [Rhodoblastus acidophilus]SNB65222.1 phosphoribosylamine--glycine ligase [Rhodoblastus acidophilus]
MNVLLIGSGGREHALALALAKSPLLKKLFVAPGNPGTAQIAANVVLDVADAQAVIAFCHVQHIGFVVIGPEQPLVDGLVDALEAAGIKAFGPSKQAARLEGSKGFTKDLCAKYNIPTGAYERFTDRAAALAYVREKGAPIVIKADGLAAGKGVTVAMTLAEAEKAVDDLFGGAFGAAGAECVIEEFLDGEEASFFALCDGDKALAFASAQDHKRVGDGDVGPNTGGMGAYSPAPVVTEAVAARVMAEIVAPTVAAMKAEGCPFKGVLFVGLMIGADGPKLIEFNTRFGDPECQVMLARLEDDLLSLLLACAEGRLPQQVHLSSKTALTVVMAARGYPGAPKKGGVIARVAEAEGIGGVTVIHAGTKANGDRLVANGGRVLNVVALADSVAEAQTLAYRGVDALDFADGFCRRDIGWRALGR